MQDIDENKWKIFSIIMYSVLAVCYIVILVFAFIRGYLHSKDGPVYVILGTINLTAILAFFSILLNRFLYAIVSVIKTIIHKCNNDLLSKRKVREYEEFLKDNEEAVRRFIYQSYSDKTLKNKKLRSLSKYRKDIDIWGRMDLYDYHTIPSDIIRCVLKNRDWVLDNYKKDMIYYKGVCLAREYPYGFVISLAREYRIDCSIPSIKDDIPYGKCEEKALALYKKGHHINGLDSMGFEEFHAAIFEPIIQKEEEIKKINSEIERLIEIERIEEQFNKVIISYPQRSCYFNSFLRENNITTDKKKYCLDNLKSLDAYCQEKNRDFCEEMKKLCPLGVEEFKRREPYSNLSDICQPLARIRQYEEDKRYEKKQRREEAVAFVRMYPNLTPFNLNNLSDDDITKILDIKQRFDTTQHLKNAAREWENEISGIPYHFFYPYYPVNRFRQEDISDEDHRHRKAIWVFKDGCQVSGLDEKVETKLCETFSFEELKELTLVCIPASTPEKNKDRYERFSNRICKDLGMRNAYPKIRILEEREAGHLGGSHGRAADYELDQDFFDGANVVLFDDVVTRGRSMGLWKNLLEQHNASVICAISLGKTV